MLETEEVLVLVIFKSYDSDLMSWVDGLSGVCCLTNCVCVCVCVIGQADSV